MTKMDINLRIIMRNMHVAKAELWVVLSFNLIFRGCSDPPTTRKIVPSSVFFRGSQSRADTKEVAAPGTK